MATIVLSAVPLAFKKLFDQQAELAIKLFGDKAGIEALFPLLKQIGGITQGKGRIPFVIVVRSPTLTLSERMAKIVLNNNVGTSLLVDHLVINFGNVPRGHYLAVDVETGWATRNTKPIVCLTRFKRDGRFGGTVGEGIAAVTYEPEILWRNYICLPGSCCIDKHGNKQVPCLFYFGGRVELSAAWKNSASPQYGSLSCRNRLAPGG